MWSDNRDSSTVVGVGVGCNCHVAALLLFISLEDGLVTACSCASVQQQHQLQCFAFPTSGTKPLPPEHSPVQLPVLTHAAVQLTGQGLLFLQGVDSRVVPLMVGQSFPPVEKQAGVGGQICSKTNARVARSYASGTPYGVCLKRL